MAAIAEKRVDIKLGFMCNNNCRFCVQAEKRKLGDRSTSEIKKELEEARKTGCEGVVFTGGEPSIRKDILELVAHAKELGFNTIQLQTNGRRFFYKDFCDKIIRAGMNEFSPALHGHTPELHDSLTRSPGSFNQTVQAIKNIRLYDDIRIISNTVVTKPNYRYLPEIARLLVSLGIDQYQLAFVHAMGNAKRNFDSMVPRVSLAAPYIKKGLQVGIDAGLPVMAEALTPCTMTGYEKYLSENFIPPTEIRDADGYVPDFARVRKNFGKIKFPQCKQCKYDSVCEGPWREYPERFGSGEFRPIPKENIVKGSEKGTRDSGKPRITLCWTLYNNNSVSVPDTPVPNMSIAYLSKTLEANNYEVICLDFNVLVYNNWGYHKIDNKNKNLILKKLVRETEKTNSDILGIGCWTEGITFVRDFVKAFKRRNPDVKIILGGYLATYLTGNVMEFIPEIDYVVRGEGENTILEIADNIRKHRDVKNVLGTSFREGRRIVHNPDRQLMKNLDDLPLLDYENFLHLGKNRGLNIVTSRGCPHNCRYCSTGDFYNHYRFHSADYVIRQMKHLIDLYGVEYISISEENVLCNHSRIMKLCKMLEKENLDCKFPASGRSDDINDEIIKSLKRANVPWLTVGVENIIPKVLEYYSRTQDPVKYVRNLDKSIELLEKHGIGAAFSFIVGSPVETEKDISRNLEFMKSVSERGFLTYASVLRLVPGSFFWSDYERNNIEIFRFLEKTDFPYDDCYLDNVWMCPQIYAFKNNHYTNREFRHIISKFEKSIHELNKMQAGRV